MPQLSATGNGTYLPLRLLCKSRTMSQDFEVTLRVRLTVEDAATVLAAAGRAVPEDMRSDPDAALRMALQAIVRPPDVAALPGIRTWSGLGWVAQVGAEPLRE